MIQVRKRKKTIFLLLLEIQKMVTVLNFLKINQIPEGHCWIAGDNAPASRDSRDYGPIPLALVKGKVIARIWPPNQFKWITNGLEPVVQN